MGVADATEDTIHGLGPLFPDPGVVDPHDLMDYYGPAAPPLEDQPPSVVTLDMLRSCLAAVPSSRQPTWKVGGMNT